MKHIQFLNDLARARFSGQLVLTAQTGRRWHFYLSQGRILHATGGAHPVRRWRRYLMLHCPQRPSYRTAWQQDLAIANPTALNVAWDFALLALWTERKQITRQQLTSVMGSIISEVLFDVAQAVDVTHKLVQQDELFPELAVVEVGEAIAKMQRLNEAWQASNLFSYSPDQAPILRHALLLQECMSPESYRNLARWLTGHYTLQDLAVQMRRDLSTVLLSLLPFIQKQWIELLNIADLAVPAAPQTHSNFKLPQLIDPASKTALVACVDDSFPVRYMMEKLLLSAGYEFVGIDDPLRAMSTLLARKPDFIFLDLMMPKVNGNEVCEHLRKLPCFRKTPIVILTGSDGYANRLRCNFAGATEFLTKPLDDDAVLSVIRKYLVPAPVSFSGGMRERVVMPQHSS